MSSYENKLSRRAFTGAVGVAAAGLGAAPAQAAGPPSGGPSEREFRASRGRPSRRPNILFILGDDLGWADLSAYGSPHIRTPHLDRLARQGVRFTDAYAGSATCSPTRFSLYTGRYPARTRGGLAEPIADKSVGLEPTHPTLASLLQASGYATALIGKWHAGHLPDHSPTKSGWEEFFGNFLRDLFWRVRGERALRRGNWKYYRGKSGRDQLFDLAGDIREQADKAAVEPARLAELRAAWEAVDAGLLPYPA
ncbi:sulfatase-like hydrolase/transferase [Streptomyces sp. F8]|uniref:sulfatase-like hydrolase/transferase n=1 Tax=Streptomyces sp. F8 TaxID=1436085 RepID=UPI0029CDCFE4|nr:sulfatase-like hydrolase/transferase [Streptomyces sp. F8]MDX6758343.1 sulfatase-like hydrolase/transferase [Streptomyces sp. F8]